MANAYFVRNQGWQVYANDKWMCENSLFYLLFYITETLLQYAVATSGNVQLQS